MRNLQPLRVLVVDDEPLGCQRIAKLLQNEPGVALVGTAESGDSAVDAIRALRPDLVFLDIQMPGKTGLDVVEAIGEDDMPVTIFVTAYDQFALRAFDLAAIDYLVKPFDNERFEQAFRRARRQIELGRVEGVQAQIGSILAGIAAPRDRRAPAPHRYLERFAVHMRGRTRVVPASEIDYITASGAHAELHVGKTRHVIRESLQTLEEQLDPEDFIRIHRSTIVRLDLIDAILRADGGDYHVQLRNGVTLKVSRYRREQLDQRLGKPR